MRVLVLAVLFILSWVGRYSAQSLDFSQRCSLRDNAFQTDATQCGTYGNYNLYCDSSSLTCRAKTEIPLDNAATFSANHAQEVCTDGYRPSTITAGSSKCVKVAMLGCNVKNRLHNDGTTKGNIVCAAFGQFNQGQDEDDDGTCVRRTGVTGANWQTVDFHSLCEYNKDNNQNNRQVCGHNLYCNSNAKCVRRGDVGDECGHAFGGCLRGLVCNPDKGVCIKAQTLPHGSPCPDKNSEWEGCASGYCGPHGVCQKSSSNDECFRNSDCQNPVGRSVCVGVKGDKPGKCLATFFKNRSLWYGCVYSKCKDHFDEEVTEEQLQECMTRGEFDDDGKREGNKCMKEYARYKCAEYCVKPKDQRRSLLDKSDEFVRRGAIPFSFNCKELSVTKLTSDDCAVSDTFSNCDAILDYPSHANTIQVSFMMMASMVAVALAALL